MQDLHNIVSSLWELGHGKPEALECVDLPAEVAGLPSIFRIGAQAVSTQLLVGLAASELFRLRTGESQCVGADTQHASVLFRCERYARVSGDSRELMSDLMDYYPTRDGGWFYAHLNYPHHRQALLDVLGCDEQKTSIANAIKKRDGEELEEQLYTRGGVGVKLRSEAEWLAHPQGQAVDQLPLIEIFQIGDAPPEPLPGGCAGDDERPLSGVRVLELTRVIAGPVAGRTLGEHGADVLHVRGEHLPTTPQLDIETGYCKRSAWLDLRNSNDFRALTDLSGQADVFLQGYRPGALAHRGLSPETLAETRPGLIYAGLSAWGHAGPWAGRRGFDSIVQVAGGIAHAGQQAAATDKPFPLPCQALDHASGYLLAYGVMRALALRAEQGGSWQVRVSLAQTSRWLQRLGHVDSLAEPWPEESEIDALSESMDSALGALRSIRPAVQMALSPPRREAPVRPGSSAPQWR